MKKRTLITALGLVLVCLTACKSDPKASARDFVAKGDQQLAQKKLPEAIIEYRRAVQADPRLGRRRVLGEELFGREVVACEPDRRLRLAAPQLHGGVDRVVLVDNRHRRRGVGLQRGH